LQQIKTSGASEVYRDIFALSSVFFAASFLIALTLPDIGVKARKKGDYFSIAVLKKNWDIYFGFFLRQIGANNVWVIFPLYLVSLGANKYEVAIIYAINPVLQFFIMRKLDKYDTKHLIHVGDIFSAAAFLSLIPLTILLSGCSGTGAYRDILRMSLCGFHCISNKEQRGQRHCCGTAQFIDSAGVHNWLDNGGYYL